MSATPNDNRVRKFLTQVLFELFSRDSAVYASSLLGLPSRFTDQLPTAAISPTEVLYNKEFMWGLTFPQAKYVEAHEALHLSLLHPFRGDKLKESLAASEWSHMLWNWACDVEANGFLNAAHLGEAPENCVPGKTDTTAEREYMEALKKAKKFCEENNITLQQLGGAGDPQDGDGQGGGDSSGLEKEGQAAAGKIPEGVGLPGQPLDHVGMPRNADGSEMSKEEKVHAEVRAKVQLQEAVAQHMKDKGTVPAGMEYILKELLEAKTDWRDILSRIVTQVYDRNDYSFKRPNTRRQAGGLKLPSLRSPAPPRICFCGDTSGSVSDAELKEVCSEVVALVGLYNESGQDAPIDVIWFDRNTYYQEVWDEADIEPKGRGGTSFRRAFERVAELDEPPSAVVFATDGYDSGYEQHNPGVPVLWVLTANCDPKFDPPFGEVVVKQ